MKFQNLIWIVSLILISLVSNFIFAKLYNKSPKLSKTNNSNIIKPNKTFFNIGILGFIGAIAIVVIYWLNAADSNTLTEKIIYSSLILLFFLLLGGYLIFFYINYRIIVFGDHFLYQNFWRIKKTIRYEDIVINRDKLYPQIRIKQSNGKTKLVFKLAGILENEDAFMTAYKNWKTKPKSKKNKVDTNN